MAIPHQTTEAASWPYITPLVKERGAPIVVGLVAALVNFFGISRLGDSNTYYAAAVKSMLQNWHNFFFVAFDPAGFVAVDKPPVSLWLQAISAKIFGFNGFSLILPQVLAGIAAAVLLFYIVQRTFGMMAGFWAGIILAITPVSAVVFRSNLMDGVLVLVMVLVAGALLRAAEEGSLRWLLAAGALVGLGFNVKMLEAYLIIPAMVLVYLVSARTSWRKRFIHLALAGALMFAISLSWAVVVDSTPVANRPYVGSSTTNSEVDLAFGYNGLQRLTGLLRGGTQSKATNSATNPVNNGFLNGENGAAGPLRLFNQTLGGQASWLITLGLVGLLSTIWGIFPLMLRRQRLTRQLARDAWNGFVALDLTAAQRSGLFYATWFLTAAVFFSVAGFFHAYYLSQIVPPIAAMAGVGIVGMWRDYRGTSWQRWLLPIALLVTGPVEAHLISPFSGYGWLANLVTVVPVIAAIALAVPLLIALPQVQTRLRDYQEMAGRTSGYISGVAAIICAVGIAALLLAPTVWTIVTDTQSTGNALVPSAGPSARAVAATGPGNTRFPFPTGGFPAGGFNGDQTQASNQQLLSFLATHGQGTKYPLATLSSMTASPIIIASNIQVANLGGFSGNDPVVSVTQFQHLVQTHELRYILTQGIPAGFPGGELPPGLPQGFGGGRGVGGQITSWVSTHCTAVPTSQWRSPTQSTAGNPFGGGGRGGSQLYDCGTLTH